MSALLLDDLNLLRAGNRDLGALLIDAHPPRDANGLPFEVAGRIVDLGVLERVGDTGADEDREIAGVFVILQELRKKAFALASGLHLHFDDASLIDLLGRLLGCDDRGRFLRCGVQSDYRHQQIHLLWAGE